jgi:hypothetical protein
LELNHISTDDSPVQSGSYITHPVFGLVVLNSFEAQVSLCGLRAISLRTCRGRKDHQICASALTTAPRGRLVIFICLFVLSRTSNFSAIWRLSPLPVTGLQI